MRSSTSSKTLSPDKNHSNLYTQYSTDAVAVICNFFGIFPSIQSLSRYAPANLHNHMTFMPLSFPLYKNNKNQVYELWFQELQGGLRHGFRLLDDKEYETFCSISSFYDVETGFWFNCWLFKKLRSRSTTIRTIPHSRKTPAWNSGVMLLCFLNIWVRLEA